jgi:hypothetical protein
MKPKLTLTISFIICLFAVHAADNENEIQATLKSVIVYRSGAEMMHTASALLKEGNNKLIVNSISNAIDINSIQIKAPSTVTILSVEFSNNYLLSENKTSRLLLVEDSLQHARDEINRINVSVSNAVELIDVLKSNKDIKGEQTGLSVVELSKLMDYYKTKLLELQNDTLELDKKKREVNERVEKLQKQIEEEQKKNVSNAGRLTLLVSVAIAGKEDFTVSYIAKNAYWIPFYDVRVENIKNPMKMLYKAKIVQTTGIDWKQVKLSLSTSTPAQWGNAPLLQSWFLGYIDPFATLNKNLALDSMKTLQGQVAGIQLRGISSLNDVVVVGYGTNNGESSDTYVPSPKPVYILNGKIMSEEEFQKINPNVIKKIEKLKPNAASAIYGSRAAGGATVVELKNGLEDYISVIDNTLNVVFDIDALYDVTTNGKEQTAVLQSLDINTLYQHYVIPKLDEDVYLLAEVPEWEKLNFLPGEANITFEGTYVGKSFIDPKATADTLNLTIGHDKRVIVKREKLRDFSSIKFLGTNKLQKFTYEITVKNNKNEPVNLLLKDQYPLSTNKDIEVELLETSNAELNKDIGVLNWKIQLAPGEIKTIRFAYSIKYPKDKTLNLNW